jgi:hypothetical protein
MLVFIPGVLETFVAVQTMLNYRPCSAVIVIAQSLEWFVALRLQSVDAMLFFVIIDLAAVSCCITAQ